MNQETYTTKGGYTWDVYDELPEGWRVNNNYMPPHPTQFVWITNGSILKGGKRALLRVKPKPTAPIQPEPIQQPEPQPVQATPPNPTPPTVPYPAKTVNDLARLKFKQKMLLEIQFDLMVCEVEGWDKRQYINELRRLLNSIDTSKPKTEQGGLFT